MLGRSVTNPKTCRHPKQTQITIIIENKLNKLMNKFLVRHQGISIQKTDKPIVDEVKIFLIKLLFLPKIRALDFLILCFKETQTHCHNKSIQDQRQPTKALTMPIFTFSLQTNGEKKTFQLCKKPKRESQTNKIFLQACKSREGGKHNIGERENSPKSDRVGRLCRCVKRNAVSVRNQGD